MLKPAKALFPKYRGISRNGFAESANPFRAFRGRIFVTANFRSLQKPLNQRPFHQVAFFAFAHSVAYRPRVSSIRIWQALSFSFTYVSFFGLWPRKLPPAGGIGGRGFRPCK